MKWTHAVWIVAGTLILGSPSAHAQPSPSPPSSTGTSVAQAQAFARRLQDVQNQLRESLQAAKRAGLGGIGDPVTQLVSVVDLDLTKAVELASSGDDVLACRTSGYALTALNVAAQRAQQGGWMRFSSPLMMLAFRLQDLRSRAGCE